MNATTANKTKGSSKKAKTSAKAPIVNETNETKENTPMEDTSIIDLEQGDEIAPPSAPVDATSSKNSEEGKESKEKKVREKKPKTPKHAPTDMTDPAIADLIGWQPGQDGVSREVIDHNAGYVHLVMCSEPGCTGHRWIKSSDLFQVKFCRLHQRANSMKARYARTKEKKAALREALAASKNEAAAAAAGTVEA